MCVCVCVHACMCTCTHGSAQLLNRVQLFAIPWTVVCKAPLPLEFSRQEYWNGLPFPTPGDLPDPAIKPLSLVSPALADGFLTTVPSEKPYIIATLDISYKRNNTKCTSFCH